MRGVVTGVDDPHSRLAEEHASTTARIRSLRHQIDGLIESASWTVNDDEHDPEGATAGYERAQLQGLLDQARHELEELDRAHERLRAGTYGVCRQCSKPIGEERLDALPAVTLCISCADPGRRGR